MTTTFYTGMPEEVLSGFLIKSPPLKKFNYVKAWKKRFFVFYKMADDVYDLYYFKNENKENPLGDIKLSAVSKILICPENHRMWTWIQKSFKCSRTSVILLRTGYRDFFLIGENSTEMDRWYSMLSKGLKRLSQSVQINKESDESRSAARKDSVSQEDSTYDNVNLEDSSEKSEENGDENSSGRHSMDLLSLQDALANICPELRNAPMEPSGNSDLRTEETSPTMTNEQETPHYQRPRSCSWFSDEAQAK
ncbi:pleckstrin homology domain-containing family S member 1 isoform X2 [Denticeps clupeoides]|uniref:PH domain-containing protein n=1 Tax=Denticeps clupeoides TaxID=299321 RepID=A0AAY4DF49_9TELE|nr:pleckstrin homology domain-containing family S member 1 isoform X2 [Denticeps clupeoides]XP_028844244.1 pleckstrin homology domain-containing family S member 1 isoform X2 [Denticeps clupeoides]